MSCNSLFENHVASRKIVQEYLYSISSEEARLYYELFIMMVTCDASNVQKFCNTNQISLSWLPVVNAENIARFVCTHIMVGNLIERLADAIEWDVETRKKKWSDEQSDWIKMCQTHQKNVAFHKFKSNFILTSRKKNIRAYDRVRKTIKNPTKEWEVFIVTSTADLITKPPLFWSALQANRLSIVQKRAFLHKMSMIQEDGNLSCNTRQLCREIENDIFLNEVMDDRKICCCACWRHKINVTWF